MSTAIATVTMRPKPYNRQAARDTAKRINACYGTTIKTSNVMLDQQACKLIFELSIELGIYQ